MYYKNIILFVLFLKILFNLPISYGQIIVGKVYDFDVKSTPSVTTYVETVDIYNNKIFKPLGNRGHNCDQIYSFYPFLWHSDRHEVDNSKILTSFPSLDNINICRNKCFLNMACQAFEYALLSKECMHYGENSKIKTKSSSIEKVMELMSCGPKLKPFKKPLIVLTSEDRKYKSCNYLTEKHEICSHTLATMMFENHDLIDYGYYFQFGMSLLDCHNFCFVTMNACIGFSYKEYTTTQPNVCTLHYKYKLIVAATKIVQVLVCCQDIELSVLVQNKPCSVSCSFRLNTQQTLDFFVSDAHNDTLTDDVTIPKYTIKDIFIDSTCSHFQASVVPNVGIKVEQIKAIDEKCELRIRIVTDVGKKNSISIFLKPKAYYVRDVKCSSGLAVAFHPDTKVPVTCYESRRNNNYPLSQNPYEEERNLTIFSPCGSGFFFFGILSVGWKMDADVIRTYTKISFYQCQTFCRERFLECYAINFEFKADRFHVCQLLKRNAVRNLIPASDQFVFQYMACFDTKNDIKVVKNCRRGTKMISTPQKLNTIIRTTHFLLIKNIDFEMCLSICSNTPQCLSVNFKIEVSYCYLNSDNKPIEHEKDMASAIFYCEEDAPGYTSTRTCLQAFDISVTTIKNVTGDPNDILDSLSYPNIDNCKVACLQTENCHAIHYEDNVNICVLYKTLKYQKSIVETEFIIFDCETKKESEGFLKITYKADVTVEKDVITYINIETINLFLPLFIFTILIAILGFYFCNRFCLPRWFDMNKNTDNMKDKEKFLKSLEENSYIDEELSDVYSADSEDDEEVILIDITLT